MIPKRSATRPPRQSPHRARQRASTTEMVPSAEESTIQHQPHGIEAVVFSIEDFSVDFHKTPHQQEGWDGAPSDARRFGMRRRQRWISYDTAEDLTRKVDTLFRRTRTWSSEEAGMILGNNDDFDCADTVASTTPSTTTMPASSSSVARDEEPHPHSFQSATWPFSKTPVTTRNHTASTRHRHRNSRNEGEIESDDDDDSLPEFLKGVTFKKPSRQVRKQLDVIALPPSPPPPPVVQSVVHAADGSELQMTDRQVHSCKSRPGIFRRLGRKAKDRLKKLGRISRHRNW
mmetsp:Transcript_13875/g.38996  ORF Transcript_13875/g.38996 Transcript_13875/m.38996 type:complete len:288 (-) Transcript_13875:304-1167(-)